MNRLLCWIFGHKYLVIRDLRIGGQLIECRLCGIEKCIHHGRQQVIDYDDDVKQAEKELEEIERMYR